MHATKKRAVLAALVVSGLMLVGTACGGSSSKSSDSASGSGSESSSASTSKSSGGSGGDSAKCADLLKKSEALAAKMESDGANSTDMSANMNSMVKDLESFTSSVPSEIRGDWKTIVDAFKEYATALEGVNMNNITDPATMEKLTKAGAALDSSKAQKAMENLDNWTKKNCPSLAGN